MTFEKKNRYKKLKINLVSRFVVSKDNIFESVNCQNKNIQILLLTNVKDGKLKKIEIG